MRGIRMDHEKNQMDFDAVREDCPWRYGDKCRPIEFRFRIIGISATLKDCEQKQCAIMHFKKHFGRK